MPPTKKEQAAIEKLATERGWQMPGPKKEEPPPEIKFLRRPGAAWEFELGYPIPAGYGEAEQGPRLQEWLQYQGYIPKQPQAPAGWHEGVPRQATEPVVTDLPVFMPVENPDWETGPGMQQAMDWDQAMLDAATKWLPGGEWQDIFDRTYNIPASDILTATMAAEAGDAGAEGWLEQKLGVVPNATEAYVLSMLQQWVNTPLELVPAAPPEPEQPAVLEEEPASVFNFEPEEV